MNKKYTNNIQVLLDDETYSKMQRLIMMEALDKDEPIKGRSGWVRELIEDTVNFQINKSKIEDYKTELIKKIKSK
jgi:hypothetical protein